MSVLGNLNDKFFMAVVMSCSTRRRDSFSVVDSVVVDELERTRAGKMEVFININSWNF